MKRTASKQILSILLCLAMLLAIIPITAYAARDNAPYAPTVIQEVVWSRYCIFANGTPITIEAAGSGTAVWYMDGDTKKYVNPGGANGDDLSEWIIFGGSNNPDGMNFDTHVTMTGGTVKRIYAGIYSMGYLNGTAYVTVTGGTITGGIYCGTYLSSSEDKTKTVTIFDSTGASINLGRYGVADNVVQKNGSAWTVSGNGIIPEGVTLTVLEGETLTVPSGATLTNNGALVNGGGTITVYGKLLGNAPENYIAPQDFTFNTAELEINTPYTMSEAVCTTNNTTLSPWFTYEIENPAATDAVLSGREITAKNEGTVTVKVTMNDGYCEPVSKTFDFTVKDTTDITAPFAQIKVKENSWSVFQNHLTFGLFFKETQNVTIIATDDESGVKSIQYYLSDRELEGSEVETITAWNDYNGTFKINPDNKYVIYARVTDNSGNTVYINSNGIVLDATVPVFYGIENGGVYHGDKVFKAMDENFLKIEVDGVDITDTTEGDSEYKIVADNAEHTVTATDKAGNVTEYKITVYKKYMVTYTDGEGSSYEKEFKYGEVITIPTNEIFKDTFRRAGYTLTGWQGYTEGMTMPLSTLTFTALYTPNKYTASFDTNGGETIADITVTFGEKYGTLPSSVITGLSGGNKNWYLVDAAGNVTETNIKNLTRVSTARDHTLFIKRTVLAPSVSIALTVPGGISDGYQYFILGASKRVLTATVGNMNTEILDYTYQWYKDGTPVAGATSNVLTLDGNVSDSGNYKVEVTATLKSGTNIVVTSDTATASKEQRVKILHATNTLSYDANGGQGGPQSAYSGGTSLNVSKDEPTKEHHKFIGWNTAPDGTGDSYKAEDAFIFAEDNGNGGCEVTLYAQWKAVEYTVTYTADGNPISTETVKHGKDATLPAVPHKDGHVGKWDSDGKNITEDRVVSAVYTKIPLINPDEVKPEDKTELESTKKQLEEMLEDNSYTDDDKKTIQEAIDKIDDALAELNKPDSPKTGDNSNMALWIALLIISGGALITLPLANRKKRYTPKH